MISAYDQNSSDMETFRSILRHAYCMYGLVFQMKSKFWAINCENCQKGFHDEQLNLKNQSIAMSKSSSERFIGKFKIISN